MSKGDAWEAEKLDASVAKAMRAETIRGVPEYALHRWFARRPPSLSRVAVFLSLTGGVDSASDDYRFLASPDADETTLAKAQDRMRTALATMQGARGSENISPRVLDPFAGSGGIPLEALLLGCEVTASDLNPLAAEILQATLRTPATIGQKNDPTSDNSRSYSWQGLVAEFEEWYGELKSEVCHHWKRIYPVEDQRHLIWVWGLPCPNPGCHAVVPLRQTVDLFARKLGMYASWDNEQIHFEPAQLARTNRKRGEPQCLRCGFLVAKPSLKNAIQSEGRVLPVAAICDSGELMDWSASDSTPTNPWSLSVAQQGRLGELLNSKTGQLLTRTLPHQAQSALSRYGIRTFADLFSPRQLLAGLELAQAISRLKERMLEKGMAKTNANALTTYFAFGLGYAMQFNSILSDWNPTRRRPEAAFSRLSYSFKNVFVESHPMPLLAQWHDEIGKGLKRLTRLPRPATVLQANAESLPFSDDSFDAVVTDPPYFDNVHYASLAEFYWSWEGAFASNEAKLAFVDPNIALEGRASIAPDEFAQRYEAGLRNCFRECFRVLKPGRLMCVVLTTANKAHFESYVGYSEASGFEIISVKSASSGTSSITAADIETYLVFLRKPESPKKHVGLATDSAVVLRRVNEGKPVKYEALAKLLAENLEREDIEEVVPIGSKGSDVERLQEALAQNNPRELLEKCLGKGLIRRIAKEYGLLSNDDSATQPVESLLAYFGFRIPAPGSLAGVHQVCELLRRNSSRLKAATDEREVIGYFSEASNQIEMLVKRGVYGWAQIAFGDKSEDILKSILNSDPEKHVDMRRLSFGHYLRLFQDLPDKIAASDFAVTIQQKLGRSHIYLPKRPKKNSLIDRLNEVSGARNTVAHNKEDLLPLRESLSEILEKSISLVQEMAAEHAIPQCGMVTEEVRDMWGRRSYKIQLDDGTEFEGTFSEPLELGCDYFFFGSEANPRPVDPFLVPIKRVKMES